MASTQASAAGFYIYHTPKGAKLYSDKHIYRAGYIAMNHHHAGEIDTRPRLVSPYDEDIRYFASSYGLEEALIKAIIHAESQFNPLAESASGAQGLMQLMPATATQYGSYKLLNPYQNIMVGTLHLQRLMRRYDANLELVLAAYNAGEGNVKRYNGVPPFQETRFYITRVMELLRSYRGMSEF